MRYNSFAPRTEDRLGPLLRQRIGADKFEAWFVKGEAVLVSQTTDTITIAVRSKFFADQIRNRFEPDIVACSGAPRVKVEVKAGESPPDTAIA